MRYIDPQGSVLFETANKIRIPAGRPVELLLRSENIIHSFWVPELAGKVDMIPGHVNRLRVQVDAPGIFRGQCAEYCGAQHAKMAFHVIALKGEEYDTWHAAQRQPARTPSEPRLIAARKEFMQSCAKCHTIRGTGAAGKHGPDLIHVGSRHALGAGILSNNVGALGGWIAGNQHLKPGNHMPAFNEFSGEGMRALAAYLESLQ